MVVVKYVEAAADDVKYGVKSIVAQDTAVPFVVKYFPPCPVCVGNGEYPEIVAPEKLTVPVNDGLLIGALEAKAFVTVVANNASPPKASDNSLSVLRVDGAAFTKFDIAVSV